MIDFGEKKGMNTGMSSLNREKRLLRKAHPFNCFMLLSVLPDPLKDGRRTVGFFFKLFPKLVLERTKRYFRNFTLKYCI